MSSDLITIRAAIKEFQLSRTMIWDWRRAGKLTTYPSALDHRQKLVSRREIARLVASIQHHHHARGSDDGMRTTGS